MTEPGPAVAAVTAVGAPGTAPAPGVTELEGAEAGPVPSELVADTLKV